MFKLTFTKELIPGLSSTAKGKSYNKKKINHICLYHGDGDGDGDCNGDGVGDRIGANHLSFISIHT